MIELREFGQNRLVGLETARTKLSKNIETIYNDNYTNYYLNLEANNKNSTFLLISEGIPESLKQKIQLIQSNGGKKKLDLEIQIIKKNDEQISNRFKEMWNMINEEENQDSKLRNTYNDKWRRPPSNIVNNGYKGQL